MQIKMIYGGNFYLSKQNDEISTEETEKFINNFYDNIANLDSFRMDLEDGSTMVVGKDVVSSMVLLIMP